MPRDNTAPARLAVSLGQYSDAGAKSQNQDFHGALIPDGAQLTLKGMCFAVADGISSSPVSHIASETAVKSLMSDYYCTSDAWTVKIAASRVIAATNAWLYGTDRASGRLEADGGHVCTLSALILKNRRAHILHVGDSRIWRVTGASLEPLTSDHHMTLSGETLLSRALGVEAGVEIDYASHALSPGDVFLLTTDGVHEHWQPKDAIRLIDAAPSLDEAAKTIAHQAKAAGSPDNLTIQIIRIDSLPEPGSDDILGQAANLPLRALPKAGEDLDGFRILRPIHSNNRSHIFLANDAKGRRVALKFPATDAQEDPGYLRRFLMEEWIARRLNSPHVLRAADVPERRSALYVATEFVEGQTLRQWMHDRPAPTLQEMRDIIAQIIAGLRAFHRRQMLHQDLRPDNVMIDSDGTAKIIDMGSTRVAGVQEALPPVDQGVLGTLQYSAPEYFSGDPAGPRSDQFALGVIAYEMLTGRLPYGNAVGRVQNRRDVARLRYISAVDGKNGVPLWVDDALRRACHPDPSRRFPALSEFEAALRTPRSDARHRAPLIDRHPAQFWQGVSALLALCCLGLLLFG